MSSFAAVPTSKHSRSQTNQLPENYNPNVQFQPNHSFINDLTSDLQEYRKELELIKSENKHGQQSNDSAHFTKPFQKPHQAQNLRRQIRSNFDTLEKTERKHKSILNQKEFAPTISKKLPFDQYSNSINQKIIKGDKLSFPLPSSSDPISMNETQALRDKFDKLFQQNMELKKNRIQWKEYDRVRTENTELKKKAIQLNEEIIKQRNQLGLNKRELQNMKGIDMKRLQMENNHLREQLSKLNEITGMEGSYQLLKLKVDKQSLQNQLKHAKNTISVQQRKAFKDQSFESGVYKNLVGGSKQVFELKESVSSLLNTNSILETQIQRAKVKQNNFNKQIQQLKAQKRIVQQTNSTLESDKNSLAKNLSDVKNQNKTQFYKDKFDEISKDLQKARTQKKEVIKQLEQKVKQISTLKTKIKQMAEQYAAKHHSDAETYKQKIKIMQKQVIAARKGDNSISQLDDMVKNQLFQNQKFKDILHDRSEEVYHLQEQLKELRAEAQNRKNQLEVQKVKFLMDKKNSKGSWEIEKQNILAEKELQKKQIEALKEKVKYSGEESKKKDQFIKKHLIGKAAGSEITLKYIEEFFEKYMQALNQ